MSINIKAINVLSTKEIESLDVQEATKNRIAAFALSKGWRPYVSSEDFYVPHEEVIANLLLEEEFYGDAIEYTRQWLSYGRTHLPKLARQLKAAILQSWVAEKELTVFFEDEGNEGQLVTLPRKVGTVNSINGHFSTVVSHGNMVLLAEEGASHTIVMDEFEGVLVSENRGGNVIRACGASNLFLLASNDDTVLVDGSAITLISGDNATVKVVDGRSATFLTGKGSTVAVEIEDPMGDVDNGVIYALDGYGVININSPIPTLEVSDDYEVYFKGERIVFPKDAIHIKLIFDYEAWEYKVEVMF